MGGAQTVPLSDYVILLVAITGCCGGNQCLSRSVTTDGLLRHNSHEPRRQIPTLSHDMPLMPTCHTLSDTSCHRNIQLWQLAV